jgi:raffinose/stachyose/melibiose transport system substrate-binding protein
MAAALLVTACTGASTPGPTPTQAPTATATTAASPTPVSFAGVTITIWRENYDVKGIDDINAAFQTATGATVQVTKFEPPADQFLPKWAAGERPDILYNVGFASTMAKLNAAENLWPMDDFAFAKDIQPALKEFGLLNGVRYWAPMTAPTINGLLYNKKVTTDLGVTPPTTLQEMLSFCDTVVAKGKVPDALGEKSTFMAWATLNAMTSDYLLDHPDFRTQLMANAATFTDPEYVKRIQAILDMKDHGCFEADAQAVDFGAAMTLFMEDKAAIFNCGSFCVPDLIGAFGADAVNTKVGFMPISYTKPAVWVQGGDEWGIYLPKTGDAAREAAAKAYVDFALGDGYELYLKAQLELSRYPDTHPAPDPSKIAVPFLEAEQAAKNNPSVPAIEPLLGCSYGVPGDLFTFLSEMYVGQKTAQQVAEGMDTTFKQSCKDAGVPGF